MAQLSQSKAVSLSHPVYHQLPVEALQGPGELRVPYYFMLFQGCLSTLEAGWACRLGVCRSSLHYSQANNGFFSSVAEPKNPVGKRKIVSVKLKEQCLEISVKQSDPDQPGRFLLALLNPSDVLCCLVKWRHPAWRGTNIFSSRRLQNKNLVTFGSGVLEPSLFWLKIFAEFDLKP